MLTAASQETARVWSDTSIGLRLIPGTVRLPVVITAIILCQFIYDLDTAIAATAVGGALVILNFRLRFKLLFIAAVSTTFSFLLVGNLLFSPENCANTTSFSLFIVNACGLHVGLLHAFRRTAMVFFGFAWLNSATTYELSEVFLSYARTLRLSSSAKRYILVAVHLFMKLSEDYTAATKTIDIHLSGARVSFLRRLRLRFRISALKLSAITLRLFDSINQIAFAGEGHFTVPVRRHEHDIVLRKVTAAYALGGRSVLNAIDLNVAKGERIFLAGDSGSGKSTLLRVIARYLPLIQGQVTGHIQVGGQDWLDKKLSLEESLASVRLVTEDPFEFLIGVTVGQEVMCHTSNEGAAVEALREMGLSNEWHKEVRHLSGGQKARLILACLLVSHAKIILLDNPLTQLDPDGRRAFLNALQSFLRLNDATMIVTDPFLEYFEPIVGRVVKLSNGTIAADIMTCRLREVGKAFLGDIWADLPRFGLRQRLMTGDVVCDAQNVFVKLGGNTVVRDFSMTVREHELIAVVGPNGSGKTTVMTAIAGALPVGEGTVKLHGGVGMSFQNPDAQILAPTVGAELRVRPGLRGIDPSLQERLVTRETAWLGVEEVRETLELERRMKRKLSVASMILEAKLLILDEPSVDLRGSGLWHLLERLAELRKEARGIVIITHDPLLVRLADRVVSMDGQLMQTS